MAIGLITVSQRGCPPSEWPGRAARSAHERVGSGEVVSAEERSDDHRGVDDVHDGSP